MKKFLALTLVLCAMLAMLAGCADEPMPERLPITTADAVQVVLDDLDMTIDQANPHVYQGRFLGTDCYYVYVTVDGKNIAYAVDLYLGDILDIAESDHSH